MKKGKLKSLLREAFITGGRYYIKGHIPVNIGKVEGFDNWYNKNVSERVKKTEPSEKKEPKALIIDGVSNRRELLNAFALYMAQNSNRNDGKTPKDYVNDFESIL